MNTPIEKFALAVQDLATPAVVFERDYMKNLVESVVNEEDVPVQKLLNKKVTIPGTLRKTSTGDAELIKKSISGMTFTVKQQSATQEVITVLTKTQQHHLDEIREAIKTYASAPIEVSPSQDREAIKSKTWAPKVVV